MKKPKKNKKSPLSRRKFVGGMAAGASLLPLAPYLSLTGCTNVSNNDIDESSDERVYHELAANSKEIAKGITQPGISVTGIDGIKIDVRFPGFHSFEKTAKVSNGHGTVIKTFHHISIDMLGRANSGGKPDLPFLGLLVHIPKFLNYYSSVSYNSNPQPDIFNDIIPYPAQVNFFDNMHRSGNYSYLEYDNHFYKNGTLFPRNDHVEVTKPFDIGYSRFVLVKIWPVLFDPGNKELKAQPNITINFKLVEKSQMENEYYLESPFLSENPNPIPRHERIIDPWIYTEDFANLTDEAINQIKEEISFDTTRANILTSLLGQPSQFGSKSYKKMGKELLIIYGEAKEHSYLSFEDIAVDLYKSKHGDDELANVISYSQIMNSGAENISEYIRKQRMVYFNENSIFLPALKDVILLGDLDLIPGESWDRSLNLGDRMINMNIRSDYYAGTLVHSEQQDDIVLPDICIGRIPARNTVEAAEMVENIKEFNTNTELKIRQNLNFLSYFQDSGKDGWKCNGVASTDYLQTMEYIRERLPVNINSVYDIQDRKFIDSDNGWQLKYRDGKPIYEGEVEFNREDEFKELIANAFIDGKGIIVHRDHGWMNGWSRPNFKIPDLWSVFHDLRREVNPSVIFSMNCLTGHFIGEESDKMPGRDYSCFSEVLLRGVDMPDGNHGNIKCPAVVCSVMMSPTFHNDWFLKGMMEGIYGGILQEEVNKTPGENKLGDVVNLARMLLLTCMDSTDFNMYENEIYHILGDPTIRI